MSVLDQFSQIHTPPDIAPCKLAKAQSMTSPNPKLVEAVARAYCVLDGLDPDDIMPSEYLRPEQARWRCVADLDDFGLTLSAALPLIRTATLEEAAEALQIAAERAQERSLAREAVALMDATKVVRSLIPSPQTQEDK